MVAEDIGHQLLMFGNAPLIQGVRRLSRIEGFWQGHLHAPLFKDLLRHSQSTIGSRNATVKGDHHTDFDDLLRRDANIQGIAYLRSDLRCHELDGSNSQCSHNTVLEIQARAAPDGTVQTLCGDTVHIRGQLISDGQGTHKYPSLPSSQPRPHLQALLESLV